jgi:hypothetical protein
VELRLTAIVTAFAALAIIAYNEVIKMAIELNLSIGFIAFGGRIGAEGRFAFL